MKIKPCVRFALALFVWVLLFSPQSILIVGLAVLCHECGHLAFCKILNVKVLSVTPLPWGMNISIPHIADAKKKIAISIAGPLANFLVLGVCVLLKTVIGIHSEIFDFFVLSNLAGGALNLIPAIPLDGGVIMRTAFMSAYGLVCGFKRSIAISAFVGAVILILGASVLCVTGYNFSYCAAGIFILFNLNRERRQLPYIKKQILAPCSQNPIKIKFVCAEASSHALCLLDFVTPSQTAVFLVSQDGRFLGHVTQGQIIRKLMQNSSITVGECIKK